jgi:hypothetical protein
LEHFGVPMWNAFRSGTLQFSAKIREQGTYNRK